VSRIGKITETRKLCLRRKQKGHTTAMTWRIYKSLLKIRIKTKTNFDSKKERKVGLTYPKSTNCTVSPNAAGKSIHLVYIPRNTK